MAQAEFRDDPRYGQPPHGGGSLSWPTIIGLVTTGALLLGGGIWAWKLAMHDVDGVPVIRAAEGPIRVRPEDPGGHVATHLGLAVNQVAASGGAGDVAERLVLAAPPVALAPTDGPGIGKAAPLPVVEADAMARTLALAEVLAQQALREAGVVPGAIEDTDGVVPDGAEPDFMQAEAMPPGARRTSPRPPLRPGHIASLAASLEVAAAAAAATAALAGAADNAATTRELALERLPAGTRLVQIGAYDDIQTARQEWARIAARHPALFEGKSRVIQTASSVGRTFYRLRVHGFETDDDSRRFCAAVSARDLRCVTASVH